MAASRSGQETRPSGSCKGSLAPANGCIKTELKWNMKANNRFTILNYDYVSLTKRLGNF